MDELEFGDDDTIGQIDWDSVFDENLFPPITVDGSLSDPSPDSSYMVEIENLLMEDKEDPVLEAPSEPGAKEYCDQFLADILDVEVEGDSSISGKEVVDAGSDKDKIDTTADDPISKKRTRQMRNRDAAVRSRERKKMYVKDLETKSRFFEGECRRLWHLLHCCYAENHALRLCLQSGSAFGASRTKQESAVLLLESLLLGSLLWSMGIICQIILHLVPWILPEPEVVPPENKEQKGLRRMALKGAGNKILSYFGVQSFVNSRRYRAWRTKMKMIFLVL